MTTANSTAPSGTATRETSGAGIGDNPVALLVGGVALGALVGVLLPRAAKERELLAPVGRQLADRVTTTAQAVKDAGKAEFDSLLPGRDATKEKVTALFGNILDAAKGAGQKA
ncbi:hypothetical protein RZN05_06930 [Sphingomonas sp. HF-S4]|uniref:YtxH domain-containing protein n=1 Tax=Sphingomonas agrestis TaxID=3080540 RepID=A0ABU3Y6A3_9SPHN|nr:hypothetical protein [Sphingomonas sp. HF-S4]MDV3456713.1 hypothetical protein [Sphingomonas sp. HF-S4]